MLVDVTLDLLRTATTRDIGLQREGELLEVVHTGIIVFRFQAGISYISSGSGMALELGLSTLLVGLDGLIRGTATGVGARIVGFQGELVSPPLTMYTSSSLPSMLWMSPLFSYRSHWMARFLPFLNRCVAMC